MSKWYYLENETKFGPVEMEQLRGNISKDTLVWCDGMSDWKKAGDISKLQFLLILPESEPPSIPKKTNNDDKSSEKISNGVMYALILIILSVVSLIFFRGDNIESKLAGFIVFLTGSISIRILISIKAYFNTILDYREANANINLLIAAYVPIIASSFIISNPKLILRFSETTIDYILIVGLVALILYLYSAIRLYFRLMSFKDSAVIYFKNFFGISAIVVIIMIAYPSFVSDEASLMIDALDVIPPIFLLIGFSQIEETE